MNIVNLIGRLTADPKTMEKNGTIVTRFNVAINRNKDMTDFISCAAFNKTAELIEDYFGKGDMIGLTGSLHSGSFEGKDRKKVYFTEVNISKIYFIGNRRKENNKGFEEVPFEDEKTKGRSRRYER